MTCLERAPDTCVRIDVSKDTLAVFDAARQHLLDIANSCEAVHKLIAGLAPGALVIFVPTGGYEALLSAELAAQDIACHRADTLKVKAFLKSFGRLAKTDAIDAKALAQYGTDLWRQLALYQPADETQAKLAAHVARRQDLMTIKNAETNRSKTPGNPLISKSWNTVIACLDRQIEKIDRQIDTVIAASQSLTRRAGIYRRLPGVGPRTAIALLATLPEFGTVTRRQAASLAGLAPHPRDSGTFKGYRKLRGVRPKARTSLFMADLVGARVPGPLRKFYQRLIENGKKPIVAISATNKKPLRIGRGSFVT